MKATSFDQISKIISKASLSKEIDPSTLCKRLKQSKKYKVTNKMLNAIREGVTPEIIESL